MGELDYLIRARMRRALKSGDALVTIDGQQRGCILPSDWQYKFLVLHVGRGLAKPAPVTMGRDGWAVRVLKQGVPVDVFVPWSATMSLRETRPPTGGGPRGGTRITAPKAA